MVFISFYKGVDVDCFYRRLCDRLGRHPTFKEMNDSRCATMYSDAYGRNVCHLIVSDGAIDTLNYSEFTSMGTTYSKSIHLCNFDKALLDQRDNFGRLPLDYAHTKEGYMAYKILKNWKQILNTEDVLV